MSQDQSVAREERAYRSSPNYSNGRFVNEEQTSRMVRGGFLTALLKHFFANNDRRPSQRFPAVSNQIHALQSDSGLRAAWLGHATVLLAIDGVTLLTDPVFDEHVGIQIGRTRRFQPSPVQRDDLPDIHAVIISHDHYDHLEESSIRHFAEKGSLIIVPLGVSRHLQKWGVADHQIVELDWWQSYEAAGVKLVCTPARHFSGRSLFAVNPTLWCSWAILGPEHRVYYAGDTGYTRAFKTIGEQLGPFHVTLMPIGAYGPEWPYIHLTPAQALKAHNDVQGHYLLPVHWGTYDLAFHSWREPIDLLSLHARSSGVEALTPRLGEVINFDNPAKTVDWWSGLT